MSAFKAARKRLSPKRSEDALLLELMTRVEALEGAAARVTKLVRVRVAKTEKDEPEKDELDPTEPDPTEQPE